jgi:signal transduction histidine kinase/CheY-like chemotaxis protein
MPRQTTCLAEKIVVVRCHPRNGDGYAGSSQLVKLVSDAMDSSDVAFSRPRRGWPLYVHLMLFGLALSLPVLAFAGLVLSQLNALDRLRFEERILDAAQEVAYELDQKFAGAISTVKALATSPALQQGNFEAFHHQAEAAIASSDGIITLLDQNGKPLLSTRVAWGAPLPPDANPGAGSPVARNPTGEPYITDLFVGRQSGKPIFAVSVPVVVHGQRSYTLRLSFPPATIGDIVLHYKVPAEWIVRVADSRGQIIARTDADTVPLGLSLPGELKAKRELTNEVGTAVDIDGERIRFGCSRPRLANWVTCALVPNKILEAQFARGWRILAASGTCLLALSLVGAIGLGRSLAAPIRRVARQAAALDAGRPAQPLTTWVREASEVSSALSSASLQISQRAQEVAASRAELARINEQLEARVSEQTHELRLEMRRREEAQAALVRAQKMEAIGRIGAGIAHDFNNILGVIITNHELIEPLLANPKTVRMLHRATGAAEMGARLTRRLLAVARRQELSPRTLDLNDQIEGMVDLLNRTLGGAVTLRVTLADDLWMMRADPSEVENAILNLAVNARDAMPSGGQFAITTSNCKIEAGLAAADPGLPAGDYVLLSVTDTGTGMSPDTLRQAFEPFFTTKAPGKGTGLGLATIYGFARQSHGNVTIASEPGKGTTVKIYLPRDQGRDAHQGDSEDASVLEHGRRETILVVEDNLAMRDASEQRLRSLGYKTVVADSGAAAVRMLQSNRDIDLVFSDVVMPGGMSGHELARWVRANRPETGCVLTSGFQGSAAPKSDSSGSNLKVLPKPFSGRELARAIHDALEASRDDHIAAPTS